MPSSIKIRGIAPPDVPGLPSAMRRQFWALVAPIALRVKDQELAAGLDASGEPLKPISPRTRKYRKSAMVPGGKGDPNAPPLMPARQKSRTRALLAARVVGDTHVELYWRFDPFTGDQWSRILTFQREQGRDVFGVSPDGIKRIRQQSAAAWTKWKKLNAEPEKHLPAFMSHAISSGQPQSRIAVMIARSALPGAGSQAGIPTVGTTVRKTMTRGIGAPTKAELATGQYSGGKTAAGWQRHFTEEVTLGKSGGAVVVTRPKPRPELPRAARAAMQPKAIAKTAEPPASKPYTIEYHGSLTDAEKREHENWIASLPAKVLDALKSAGYKFVYADRIATFDPVLAVKHPRGWRTGMTWENADGFQDYLRQIIFTAKERKNHAGQYVVSNRQKGVTYHETGHAVSRTDGTGYYEKRPEFLAAYAKDVSVLTNDQKAEESYLLQPGEAGPSEAFAEVFACLFGSSSGLGNSAKYFPNCANLIRKWFIDKGPNP